jgi:hypothetical protein
MKLATSKLSVMGGGGCYGYEIVLTCSGACC